MLQNRVDPIGNLIRTPARGSWLGNRGVIHNHQQEIVRPYKTKAWITCLLSFKERKRKIMMPDRWTELFFFDEATAFAAGHRPCAECRRNDFNRFKSCWLKGNPEYGFNIKTPIKDIDEIIHKERINAGKTKITFNENIAAIPDGSFVLLNDNAYLVARPNLLLWTPFGYEKKIAMPLTGKLMVLTPRSMVNTLRAGYEVQMGV